MANFGCAQTSQPVLSTSSLQGLSGASPADDGLETVTEFDQRGFPTTIVQAKGATKQYNDQGFLITASPSLEARASPTGALAQAADSEVTAGAQVNKNISTKTSSAVPRSDSTQMYLAAACGLAVLAGTLAL